MTTFTRMELTYVDKKPRATATISRENSGWIKAVSVIVTLTADEEKAIKAICDRIERENPPGEH